MSRKPTCDKRQNLCRTPVLPRPVANDGYFVSFPDQPGRAAVQLAARAGSGNDRALMSFARVIIWRALSRHTYHKWRVPNFQADRTVSHSSGSITGNVIFAIRARRRAGIPHNEENIGYAGAAFIGRATNDAESRYITHPFNPK